jgi:chloramphenicol-sensitive protein RarD
MRSEEQAGIFYTAFSYFLWGILPIYWKWLGDVSADEILANRIFWSFWFMLLFLLVTKRWKSYISYLKSSLTKKKQLGALAVASLLVSANWFIYIWAVNSNQMVEASLGYYINPLVSVLLGVFILKECFGNNWRINFDYLLWAVSLDSDRLGSIFWVIWFSEKDD